MEESVREMVRLRSQEELVSWRRSYTYSIRRVGVGVVCVGEVTPAALRSSAPKLNLAGKPEAFFGRESSCACRQIWIELGQHIKIGRSMAIDLS
jgi:hypothetical protein